MALIIQSSDPSALLSVLPLLTRKRKPEDDLVDQAAAKRLRTQDSACSIELDFSSRKLTNEHVKWRIVPILNHFSGEISLNVSDNQLTSYGCRLLMGCDRLRCLNISQNPLGNKGAFALAESRTLRELTANVCGIGLKGAQAFFENDSLEDLWLVGNKFCDSDWGERIDQRLKDNKARRDPAYREELERERAEQEVEEQVGKALEVDNVETLQQLVPQLKQGVETRMNGRSLLLLALDVNALLCARGLLNMGIRLECHEREYTPLFVASEQGKLAFVHLFLRRGGNITGEFDFNGEHALSIAAFKFCERFQGFLKEHLKRPFARHRELASQMLEWWEQIWETCSAPWKIFCKEDPLTYAKDCFQFFKRSREWYPHLDPDPTLLCLAKTFFVVLRKWLVAHEKAPSTEEDEYATDEEEDLPLVHQIAPIEAPCQQFVGLSRAELQPHVDRLNAELSQGKTEADIDWATYPKFYIALFRGNHLFRCYFTKAQRADYRRTSHLNRLTPAGATYYMAGVTPTQHQVARESVLEEQAGVVKQAFDDLEEESKEETQYWGNQGRTFRNGSEMVQQRMSSSYQGYMEDIAHPSHPTTQLLHDRGIRKGYPHVAASDLPLNALRYAFGQKPVEGLKEHRLRPCFQQDGYPLHPYPGKIFISLFTPSQLHAHRARHVAGMHNRGQISLTTYVAPERETSIPGGIEADVPFYEELVVIPSFSEYRNDYQEKYGISLDQFKKYKRQIAESWTLPTEAARTHLRKKVKKEIIEGIIIHKQRQLIEKAIVEANRRGGHLIFRHCPGEYGLEFEKMFIPARRGRVYTQAEEEVLEQLASS